MSRLLIAQTGRAIRSRDMVALLQHSGAYERAGFHRAAERQAPTSFGDLRDTSGTGFAGSLHQQISLPSEHALSTLKSNSPDRRRPSRNSVPVIHGKLAAIRFASAGFSI